MNPVNLDPKHNSILKTRRIKTSQLHGRVLAVAKTLKKDEGTEGSKKSEPGGKFAIHIRFQSLP
jgi:hypothetical protein